MGKACYLYVINTLILTEYMINKKCIERGLSNCFRVKETEELYQLNANVINEPE